MSTMYGFLRKRSESRHPKLVMSTLVRDEAKLIRHHLAFHWHMGVDGFVIMDNGSIDGTRDILADLAADYPIVLLDEPAHIMAQDVWVNRMADVAKRRLGADWVINSDADEFWFPSSHSLKSELAHAIGGLSCRRFNMLPDREVLADRSYEFYRNILKVVKPREDPYGHFPRHASLATPFPFTLHTVEAKVLCRLRGLKWIGYGNHTVRHSGRVAPSLDIQIYHYPVRTFPEFERKVINHGTSLANNPHLLPATGWHVRRWYEIYRRGQLREEYEMLVPESTAIRSWVEDGTIEEDRSIYRMFESQAFDGSPPGRKHTSD